MAYVVVATWVAEEGEEQEVHDALVTMMPLSQAEEGNLAYQAQVSVDDPRTFVIYEQYVDEAAFDAHRTSPHFQEHVVGNVLARLSDRSAQFFTTFGD